MEQKPLFDVGKGCRGPFRLIVKREYIGPARQRFTLVCGHMFERVGSRWPERGMFCTKCRQGGES